MATKDLNHVQKIVFVCNGECCLKAGANENTLALRVSIKENQLDKEIHTVRTRCMGQCKSGPIVFISPDNVWYKEIDINLSKKLVSSHLINNEYLKNNILFAEENTLSNQPLVKYSSKNIFKKIFLKLSTVLIFSMLTISQVNAQNDTLKTSNNTPKDSLTKIELSTVEIHATEVATRTKRSLDQISKSITLINQNDIDLLSPVNVQSFLDNVPGISYSRSGGLGGQIVMRGFNSNTPRTLLLIDGDRFRGRNTLEFNLIDPNQIERIEVLRGPSSTLYGPDAMAGVINVVTRRAKGDISGPLKFKPIIRNIDYNSLNNLFGARAEAQLVGKGLDFLLGVSYRKAGDLVTPAGKAPNSDFEFKQIDLRTGYTFAKSGHRIELTAKHVKLKSGRAGGIGGSPGAPLVVQREDPLKEYYAKVAYYAKIEKLNLKRVEASVYIRSLYSKLTTANTTKKNELLETVNIVDAPIVIGGKAFAVRQWKKGVFTFGVDGFKEYRKGVSTGSVKTNSNSVGTVTSVVTTPIAQNAPNTTQTDLGIFLRHDWDISSKLILSSGGRYDYILSTTETSPIIDPALQAAYDANQKNTAMPLTGEVGLIFKPFQFLHFTGNLGNSFRVPFTIESFSSNRQGAGFNIPNPYLKSEQGVTYEAGFRLRIKQFNFNATAFQSEFTNLITNQPVTYLGLPSFQNQNIGKARMQGVEFDFNYTFCKNWYLFGNSSYYEGNDLVLNKPLSYIPPIKALCGLRYTLPSKVAYFELATIGSGKKWRIDPIAERTTASYAILNFRLGYDLSTLHKKMLPISIRAGVENIFNAEYRLPTTVERTAFPQSITNPLIEPGRFFFISLKLIINN